VQYARARQRLLGGFAVGTPGVRREGGVGYFTVS